LNNAATVSKQIIEISKKFGLNLRMSRQWSDLEFKIELKSKLQKTYSVWSIIRECINNEAELPRINTFDDFLDNV
jgi:hypothetical protein